MDKNRAETRGFCRRLSDFPAKRIAEEGKARPGGGFGDIN